MHNLEMPNRGRRHMLALALLAWIPQFALAARETQPLPQGFDPGRDPAQDLDAALRIARAARRNVIVEVGGDWSSWCRLLDRFFVANGDLKRLRDRNYVWLKVNYSKESGNAAFLRRFPPAANYPHFYVLDPAGRLLHSQASEALETKDDYDPALWRAFLVKWAPQK